MRTIALFLIAVALSGCSMPMSDTLPHANVKCVTTVIQNDESAFFPPDAIVVDQDGRVWIDPQQPCKWLAQLDILGDRGWLHTWRDGASIVVQGNTIRQSYTPQGEAPGGFIPVKIEG